ncbi:hypothetical protein BLNAU_23115 [Blattamonas nauphoetae]|uniref:B30.2/SPRY domain-containing protein n=1 Tax=Blattamonas nauphoetae TaxID=2049346 RepID=A0ABQ9WR39_9EUKA|nr:hypothetical protein BLNAU_23115 [Blattamonas nauphoetae]
MTTDHLSLPFITCPTPFSSLPPLLFMNYDHFVVHYTTITRSAIGVDLKQFDTHSSILIGDPLAKGIVSISISLLSLPMFGFIGAVRMGLLDSFAPIPEFGETLGLGVEDSLSLNSLSGKLYHNTPSSGHRYRSESCHSYLNEGDCVRMEVDMDSTPRTVQFFVNGERGEHFVSGLPPSVRIGFTLFGQGTSFRIDRIARQPQPTPIDPEMDEIECWTCIVLRFIPTSKTCPTFSNNPEYSLEGLALTFTPSWPNSKDDAMSARFLGSWIEQHVSPSAEQEMEHGVETRINRTCFTVHQIHSFSYLSIHLVSWPVMPNGHLNDGVQVISR